jgi:4-alpha-glucanotransferase
MKNKNHLQLKRGAGILLPISSLASPYGIGTFGKKAYEFVDFLERAGQKYWQVLPIGPTSFGDSPYQSFSAFAGNPYFIDLDMLVEEGLLKKQEIETYNWGNESYDIDYEAIYNSRFKVLRIAYERSIHKSDSEYKDFLEDNSYWIEDYTFYMALKFHFDNKEWLLWEEGIRYREDKAVKEYHNLLEDEIEYFKFLQYLFYKQWFQLKEYANKKGIEIIGDIPLYVSLDSSDVWVNGDLFELDERKNPIHVAGVPPDAFSDEGQRWGNPLYNWEVMEQVDFSWWRERMRHSAKLYDVIRIDHFIGIVRYYSIPITCSTAIEGEWRKGPGKKLTDVIDQSIGDKKIIAEDLGVVIPEVKKVLNGAGYPGMKIIEFAFDSDTENEHLPHNYTRNMVVYGGTHDNETLVGFFSSKKVKELKYAFDYLGIKKKKDIVDAIIRDAYASVACVVIFQAQDILKLDNSARMNLPSTVGNNWRWRVVDDQFTKEHEVNLKKLADIFGR